ncbi:MAG TPA: hypothetical protein VD963_06175 [Phycisphaerales bacterium]|nr:hypothetical protein [Phycisphaerales bacterium]
MSKLVLILVSLVAMLTVGLVQSPALAGEGDTTTYLRASLSSQTSRLKAEAAYSEVVSGEKIHQVYKVAIANARPGAVYNVTVDGALIGQVRAGTDGRGTLSVEKASTVARPAMYRAQVGSIVKTGDAAGKFVS